MSPPDLTRFRAYLAEVKARLDAATPHGIGLHDFYFAARTDVGRLREAVEILIPLAMPDRHAVHRFEDDLKDICGFCGYLWPCPTSVALERVAGLVPKEEK